MRASAAAVAVLAMSVSSFAYADGMPAYGGPTYAPFSWTGLYVGGNIGYGWNNDSRNIAITNSSGTVVTTPGMTPEGAFGGGQLGYNWQRGPLVLGVEADIQGSDITDGFSRIIDAGGDRLNARQAIDYFGTVRGRIGFAWDRAFLYGTGGFAYGGVRDRLLVSNGALSANMTSNQTQTGSVVGAGFEVAIDRHWSVKAEYQHLDFGSERLTAPVLPANGVVLTSNRLEDRADTVRVGLNYRFHTDTYAPLK
jgi:outer membrane immunogenic protein